MSRRNLIGIALIAVIGGTMMQAGGVVNVLSFNPSVPIEVKVTLQPGQGLSSLSIQSTIGEPIKILSYEVNSGNCRLLNWGWENAPSGRVDVDAVNRSGVAHINQPWFAVLRFDETTSIDVNCSPIREISIETDRGTWTFTFSSNGRTPVEVFKMGWLGGNPGKGY